MIRQAQFKIKLRALLADGGLPASACGQAFLAFVAPLLTGGVLAWQRRGGGRQLVVNDAATLNDFHRQHFPLRALPAELGNRIAAVGQFRDTKAIASSENDIVILRAWHEDALLKHGKSVGAAAVTTEHGVFSFCLTPDSPYELRGHCALVENPAVFAQAEKLRLGVDLMLYGQGRISTRFVEWLTRSSDADFSLLHLPDYDPVGLAEFLRLRSRLGERVILHLPTDLESRFAKFSNRKLLKKGNSQTMLAHLRRSDVASIRHVVELMDRYNAGMEQEALLVDLSLQGPG